MQPPQHDNENHITTAEMPLRLAIDLVIVVR